VKEPLKYRFLGQGMGFNVILLHFAWISLKPYYIMCYQNIHAFHKVSGCALCESSEEEVQRGVGKLTT
jgi:hypothetical protein